MKALILQGSPKAHGSSATLAEQLAHGLFQHGISTRRLTLSEMDISPCRGCLKCQTSLAPDCVIADDMHVIYREFLNSDIIVFATPVYWWHVTGPMKTCLDRMMALLAAGDDTSSFTGKRLVLIVTYGVETPFGVEAVINMFGDMARWANVSLDIVRYCSACGKAEDSPEKLQEAHSLGLRLGSDLQ